MIETTTETILETRLPGDMFRFPEPVPSPKHDCREFLVEAERLGEQVGFPLRGRADSEEAAVESYKRATEPSLNLDNVTFTVHEIERYSPRTANEIMRIAAECRSPEDTKGEHRHHVFYVTAANAAGNSAIAVVGADDLATYRKFQTAFLSQTGCWFSSSLFEGADGDMNWSAEIKECMENKSAI